MPSIKQVEAFYWSGQLGSFVAAAERLNTTQSNISKRIQELEYTLGRGAVRPQQAGDSPDRERPGADARQRRVAAHAYARLRQIGKLELAVAGPFRFGVTEAVALTWLPRFSALIQSSFEGLIPISTVDTSLNLNQLLLDRKIDLGYCH